MINHDNHCYCRQRYNNEKIYSVVYYDDHCDCRYRYYRQLKESDPDSYYHDLSRRVGYDSDDYKIEQSIVSVTIEKFESREEAREAEEEEIMSECPPYNKTW